MGLCLTSERLIVQDSMLLIVSKLMSLHSVCMSVTNKSSGIIDDNRRGDHHSFMQSSSRVSKQARASQVIGSKTDENIDYEGEIQSVVPSSCDVSSPVTEQNSYFVLASHRCSVALLLSPTQCHIEMAVQNSICSRVSFSPSQHSGEEPELLSHKKWSW